MMSQSMSFLYFYDIVVLVIEIIGGLNTCRPTEKEYLTVNPPTPPQTYSLYHSLMMEMKLILLATLASLALGAIPLSRQSPDADDYIPDDRADGNKDLPFLLATGNTDPMVELDEEQFEIEFGLEPITDPVEKERRQKALEKAEKDEKEQNEKFLKKESDFFERLNEWSDLPEDEF